MKFAVLKKHLQTEPLKAAYFVMGDDAFVRDLAVMHFKNRLITNMPEMNISVFSETQDGMQIADACEILPVLCDRRLILCYDYKGSATEILRYLEKPNPLAILVFVAQKLTENFSKLALKTEPVDCGRLDDGHIAKWVGVKLQETNTEIDIGAFGLLLLYCGRNMTRISREVEKLGVFRADSRITEDDVQNLVTPETEYKVYELSDAVAAKNPSRAAHILKTLLESGTDPSVLLGVIYGHFRRLLYCLINSRDPDLAKNLGVQEYAVKMAAGQARSFSPVRLKRICDEFHRVDFTIKQGGIGDRAGLETYILRILTES